MKGKLNKINLKMISIVFIFGLILSGNAIAIPIPLTNPAFHADPNGLGGWTAMATAPGAAHVIEVATGEWGANLITGDLGSFTNAYSADLSQTFAMPDTTDEVTWDFWFDTAGITTAGYSNLGFKAKLESSETTVELSFYKTYSSSDGISYYNIYHHPSLTVKEVDWGFSFWVTSGDLGQFFDAGESITLSYTEYGLPNVFVPDIVVDNQIPTGGSTTDLGENVTLHPIPEPATFLLIGSGLIGISAVRKKRRRS